MRITNGMLVRNFQGNLQTSMAKVDKYATQMGTGKKINRLSDDPIGVLNALTARSRLARFEQYQKNLNTARNWVEQCDASLQEVSSLITDIRDQVENAATTIKTDSDRQNISALVKELKQTLLESLNSSVGKQYIFAGYNTTNQPFTVDGSGNVFYNGLDISTDLSKLNDPTFVNDPANAAEVQSLTTLKDQLSVELNQQLKIEVGYSYSMDVAVNGLQIVGTGPDNLFNQLNEIIKLMDNPAVSMTEAVEQLSSKLGNLDKSQSKITTALARVGAMETRIDMLEARYAEDIVNYNEIRSNIEDIDTAEAAVYWQMAQYVYEQTLAVGARIIQPTLMDFLR